MSAALLRRNPTATSTSAVISTLLLLRSMGSGPRTFRGGASKWKYRRMQERLTRDKERKHLHLEKQQYESRLRSEIRAAESATKVPGTGLSSDHIRALADRFIRPGAEDLWNLDDGPPRPLVRNNSSPRLQPIDLRNLVPRGRHGNTAQLPPGLFNQTRRYSGVTKKRYWNVSSDEEDEIVELKLGPGDRIRNFMSSRVEGRDTKSSNRFPRFRVGSDEDEDEEEVEVGGDRRKMKSVEDDGVSERVKELRKLVNERVVVRRDWGRDEVRGDDSVLTEKRFDECGISPLTIKALASAGYLQMTAVQAAALPVCLEGNDALVKARTGTGKTAAFLLPAIETAMKATTSKTNTRVPPISVLILSPTRELATLIAAEANVILQHHEGIGLQTLIGGTRFKVDQKRLDSGLCQIIVATPARLLDHIENKSGFSMRLMGLKLLILDEVDHLLDLGFRKDIEKVVDCIPRKRQSLLFSSTISKEVSRISQLVLKKEHAFIDTVGVGGLETPVKILQSYLVAPHELHFHILHHILKEHIMKEPEYKVMVFCTTAMVAAFTFVFLRGLNMNAREMHSKKPQLYRSRMSDEFRESKRIILVTSDISARGVNYPDVTLVVQIGMPPERDQYIHRVGRTGRDGKGGESFLLLAPWEEYFMDGIGDLPVQSCQLPVLDPDTRQKVEESIGKVDMSIKEEAYHAWLGYYNSIGEIGRDKTALVELAARFSRSIGLQMPPSLLRKTALKMGLKGIPGIRIRK